MLNLYEITAGFQLWGREHRVQDASGQEQPIYSPSNQLDVRIFVEKYGVRCQFEKTGNKILWQMFQERYSFSEWGFSIHIHCVQY